MKVDLDRHDIEMIIEALNSMSENIKKQQEEPTEYQPYTIRDVEDMTWYLQGMYN